VHAEEVGLLSRIDGPGSSDEEPEGDTNIDRQGSSLREFRPCACRIAALTALGTVAGALVICLQLVRGAPRPRPVVPRAMEHDQARLEAYTVLVPIAPAQGTSLGNCSERGGHSYALDWKAQGPSFWDGWNYLQSELNHGAAEYLAREAANELKVTMAFDTHAILRPGPRGTYLKRTSAKLETKKKWKYFLMAMKYDAVPWGCGIWPALWTLSPDAQWPTGGELDILEYANDLTSRSALHVDPVANRCRLDSGVLNQPGCAKMADAENNFTGDYDCATRYPDNIGCAPNDVRRMLTGQEMAANPSVVAAEWTAQYVKIFRIPVVEIPADLLADAPRPDGWDRWLVAYYPFEQSERSSPGSCPNPGGVMKSQRIMLNLGFCGDWASKVWATSPCANRGQNAAGDWSAKGPLMPTECVAVDPNNPQGETPAGPRDCCTRFIFDEGGAYGTDAYLEKHGYFNISWIKVYQTAEPA